MVKLTGLCANCRVATSTVCLFPKNWDRGTVECSDYTPPNMDSLKSGSGTIAFVPKEIDPHQPGAKLDQDKDRWDLLMDFAPFPFDLYDIKGVLGHIRLDFFEHWMLYGVVEMENAAQYCHPEHVVKVATYCAKKYSDGGWLSVPNGIRRYRAAAIRHRIAMETEEKDAESGLPHAWHVEWNLWAVYTLEQKASEKRGI